MAKNLDIAERIIRAEHERLCNVAGLVPVPLDVYVCDAEAPPTEKTALGLPIANSDPCYSGSVRLMALPLCEGNEWPTTISGFPPRGLDKHSDEWPVWRIEIWHEVVHQVTNDICGKRSSSVGAFSYKRGDSRAFPDGPHLVAFPPSPAEIIGGGDHGAVFGETVLSALCKGQRMGTGGGRWWRQKAGRSISG